MSGRATQTSVLASHKILPSVMGQHLSSLSNFSCTFHLVPCYSHPHHFLFLMLASLRVPGYLLASVSLFHLETASFFLSMAILAPPCSLESQGASFHLLSLLFNEKMGSFLPATASATKHCPSFQSHSSYSNGLAWTEREEGWLGTECTVFGGSFGLLFPPFCQHWPQH